MSVDTYMIGRIVHYTDENLNVWPAIVVSMDRKTDIGTLRIFTDSNVDDNELAYNVCKSTYEAGYAGSECKWQWPKA